ncbi:MAG TPA: hypothetical protein PLS26_13705 [Bacteroidales bacterium]|nr:hypothetical protein [Bacteroidales bacterium]
MKIILDNIEQFTELHSAIHSALCEKVDGYAENSIRWCEPQYSLDGSKIACEVEITGVRGQAMAEIIKGFEVVEIENTDEFWFAQELFKMEK